MPVLVALSRMYRGEHHPTDILGSLLFSALWLTAATLLIKPSADEPVRSPAMADRPRTTATM
jgi:undecaprenyl-diphosphatase